jgi:DNA-3-methyladenine glycosylase II
VQEKMILQKDSAAGDNAILLHVVKPYDFALSLRVIRSFQPAPPEQGDRLLLATRINETPTVVEVSQNPAAKGELLVTSTPKTHDSHLGEIVAWVLFADLKLTPFYRLTDRKPKLKTIMKSLRGLKPMRPVSLFEMAVIAITEQQISLAAAYRIKSRIVQRFGEAVDNQWIFPEPHILAVATPEELGACGLSRQKAQYIHDLASKIANGTLDLDTLKNMDDDEAREAIMKLRGFGRWSADYILVRGLARPDCVPIDDLGIRSVMGQYLGDGQRVTPDEAAELLEPFRPYRGLLAFYLLAKHRLDSAIS